MHSHHSLCIFIRFGRNFFLYLPYCVLLQQLWANLLFVLKHSGPQSEHIGMRWAILHNENLRWATSGFGTEWSEVGLQTRWQCDWLWLGLNFFYIILTILIVLFKTLKYLLSLQTDLVMHFHFTAIKFLFKKIYFEKITNSPILILADYS